MADASAADAAFMREAIALARRGVQAGHGGPFGALIVRAGQVVGRGWNRVIVDRDPTAHAEILAIREAGASLGDHRLRGCTLYTSCEPCPMCLAAAYWARLERVVFAAGTADAAALGFDDPNILGWMTHAGESGSLPMAQIQREQALEVFRFWQESPLRVDY
jgi:tRNA(Arg) A34 adenosine deaminase TadA